MVTQRLGRKWKRSAIRMFRRKGLKKWPMKLWPRFRKAMHHSEVKWDRSYRRWRYRDGSAS